MADDFNNKMDQVKSLLENENMVNSLKSILSLLGNSAQGDQKQVSSQAGLEDTSPKEHAVSKMPPLNPPPQQPSMDETMNTIIRIKNAYDKISMADDPRTNLLIALKPYLNSKRKTKLETAIKVANLTKLSSVISREFERF